MSKDTKIKIHEIIIDKLGVNESAITKDAKFIDDLGADSLRYCRINYAIRRRI